MSYTNMKHVQEGTFSSLQDARQEFRTGNTSAFNSLADRLTVTEVMVQAMWNMLSKRDATREELFAEIEAIMEKNKNRYEKVPKYTCPKCGKIMQIGNKNPFTCNCMYCGAERIIYPYDNTDDLDAIGDTGYYKEAPATKDPLDDLGF